MSIKNLCDVSIKERYPWAQSTLSWQPFQVWVEAWLPVQEHVERLQDEPALCEHHHQNIWWWCHAQANWLVFTLIRLLASGVYDYLGRADVWPIRWIQSPQIRLKSDALASSCIPWLSSVRRREGHQELQGHKGFPWCQLQLGRHWRRHLCPRFRQERAEAADDSDASTGGGDIQNKIALAQEGVSGAEK